jgi:acyl-CoA synthetase (AMP-forming)/AMP-acid ligase II
MKLFPEDVFNLADIALAVARTDPDRLAVVEPDGRAADGTRRYRRHTYRELSHDAESVAVGLRERGIAERTRTVFMAPPSYGACVLALALTRVGATTVWIDPTVGYRNVAERLRRVEPEAFVGIPLAHLGRLAFGWGPRLCRKLVVIGAPGFPGAASLDSLRRPVPESPAAPAVGPDDPVSILYTTGSTGPAKPALYLHRNLCQVYRIVHQSWGFDPERQVAVDMAVFPAFLTVGTSAGGTVVVPPIDFVRQGPADADPEALLEVIRDCGVGSMFGSPALLENLANAAKRRGVGTPTLKRVIGGGAPIFATVTRSLLEMMGEGGEVLADYGATEALPSTELGGREALRDTFWRTERGEGVCVGRPFAGVEVKIIGIVDGPVASTAHAEGRAPGDVGEIVIRSPHVSPRYFRDEESTLKNKIADAAGGQWHRTGDAGYLDEQGRLWTCGRLGQRVNTPAGALFALQCEPVFDAHPRVRRSGLVGVPAQDGQIPVICVEIEGGAGGDAAALREELLALAAANPATRDIRHVLFHPRLPVDPRHNSKIERPALARWAARQRAALGRPLQPSAATLAEVG